MVWYKTFPSIQSVAGLIDQRKHKYLYDRIYKSSKFSIYQKIYGKKKRKLTEEHMYYYFSKIDKTEIPTLKLHL